MKSFGKAKGRNTDNGLMLPTHAVPAQCSSLDYNTDSMQINQAAQVVNLDPTILDSTPIMNEICLYFRTVLARIYTDQLKCNVIDSCRHMMQNYRLFIKQYY